MKKSILLVFILISNTLFAQNLLSPSWKISFTDTSDELQNQFHIDNWKPVNLLLSWERQGYFWQNSSCCLANTFDVPGTYQNSNFTLTLSLQCNVQSIYINGNYIGGNLPNQFWSNRDAQTAYPIPNDMLVAGSNLIIIFASDLSYTGGRSHNLCTLTPSKPEDASVLKISVPTENHLFSIDDKKASINLEYQASQTGSIELLIVSDFHDTLVHKIMDIPAGDGTIPFNFTNDITQPGFYECVAIMKTEGYSADVKWVALSPEKIVCSNETVSGFKAYWDEALDELEQIKPEFRIKKSEELSAGTRDGYIAEMQSLGGLTIRGYYFVPRTPGKHAAILHVPGYSYGFEEGKPFLDSKENIIELALCVRGHGISADVFNPGFGIPGIWGYQLCSEKDNAYRAIYMDCVRAVEFLLSRAEVDTNHIYVMGGSQGGGLTLAVAGLCRDKIKACAYFDPFMCDTRDQLKIRTLCNSEIKAFLKYYNNACSFEQALHVQDLIDVKGFASWIQCPVFFATALFDDDCPPHMGFAAYNKIQSPKQFKIYPEDSHLSESNAYAEMKTFLLNQ